MRMGCAKCIKKPLYLEVTRMFTPGDRALNGPIGALPAQPRRGSWRREKQSGRRRATHEQRNHPAPWSLAIKTSTLGLSYRGATAGRMGRIKTSRKKN